jgi:hypothetical protein
MMPELDRWLPSPTLGVSARREARVAPAVLWEASEATRVADTGLLGRLIRWRIPGTPAGISFGELFRSPPFVVLEEGPGRLVSGLVGRIWTLRRDYPQLTGAEEFEGYDARGNARVVFAHWVEPLEGERARLRSEVRVQAIGRRGALGVAAVRPLVVSFGHLVGAEGLAAAVRTAERAR